MSLLFFSVFFSRETDQVVTGHPHKRLFSSVLVLLFLPAALAWFIAFFGRASCFLAFSRGAILGPARFWDSPGTYGLSSLAPSEAPFLGTRGGRGVSLLFVFGFCFPLLFLLCGRALSRCSSRWSRRSGLRGSPQPPFLDLLAYFVRQRVTGTLGRTASGTFLLGRGPLSLPLQALFSHARLFFPAPGFFLSFSLLLAFETRARLGELCAATQRVPENSPLALMALSLSSLFFL